MTMIARGKRDRIDDEYHDLTVSRLNLAVGLLPDPSAGHRSARQGQPCRAR
jgi:hypothetical protein